MSDNSEKQQSEEKVEKNANQASASGNNSDNKDSKKSSKIILFGFIGVTCVLMITLGMLATLLISGGKNQEQSQQVAAKNVEHKQERKEEKKEEHKEEKKEEKKSEGGHEGKEGDNELSSDTPQFYQVRPSIVITLPSSGRTRYVSLDIDLMTHSTSSLKKIEAYAPLIKNNLIDLLSKQSFEEMITEEGKKNIRKQALTTLQALMTEQAGDPTIEQVLFTSFIVQ